MLEKQNDKLQVTDCLSKAQSKTQGPKAMLAEAKEGECLSSSFPLGDVPQYTEKTNATGPDRSAQEQQSSPATTIGSPDLCARSDCGSIKDQKTGEPGTSQSSASTKKGKKVQEDLLAKKAGLLEQFLLHKFELKQPITMNNMLKVVKKQCKAKFPEILRQASERIEVLFAAEVKEVDPLTHTYAIISKMNLPHDGRVSAGKGLPKTGLLMILLGVILLKGNRASEEEIWDFLNKMHVFAGKKHFIYGEPRKLITKDLVKLKYLEYRQVPNSCPPRHEFLWGTRAYAETTKKEVLEYLAKVNNMEPSTFTHIYEQALREEEEQVKAIEEPVAASSGKNRPHSKATSSSASNMP